MNEFNGPIFRVSKNTEVNKLASAIYTNMENLNKIKLSCIGAASTQQAMKAVATARGMATVAGFDILMQPFFNQVIINDEEKTALEFLLQKSAL